MKKDTENHAHFKPEKNDLLAGTIGFRADDGSIIKTVPFYKRSKETIEPGKISQTEDRLLDDLAKIMVKEYAKYVERFE